MKVNEVLAQHPAARWVFAAYHINGCGSCPSSEAETLEQVATAYGIPLERLVSDLNALVQNR